MKPLIIVVTVWIILAAAGIAAEPTETLVVYGDRNIIELDQSSSLVHVVDSQVLQKAGLDHPNAYLEGVPGLWVSRGSGQEHLTAIRSPVFTGAGSCGAFWMAEDGIALRAKGFCNANQLFDAHFNAASSVEVYKGPFTALFGSNAQFGGLNIRVPNAGDITSRVELQGSNLGFKQIHTRGGFNIAEHDVAVLATAKDDDNWRSQSGFGQQNVTLKHAWESGNWRVENGLSTMHLEQETAGYVEGQDAYKDPILRRANINPEAFRDADSTRFYSRWIYTNGLNTWTFTPYARDNRMAFLMHFVPWQPLEINSHKSLGGTVQWRHEFEPGGDVFVLLETEHTNARLLELQAQPAPFSRDQIPEGRHYNFTVKATGQALALGFNLPLSERLHSDGAVRWDTDEYQYHTLEPSGWVCAMGVTGCRFYRPEDQNNHFTNTSAQLGLVLDLSTQASLFARISNGFRLPQAAELYRAQAQNINTIEPEKISGWELGLRSQWRRFNAQAAVYGMDNNNGIFQDTERRYVNGARTQHQGFEYEIVFAPSDEWRLSLNGELAKHTYENNPQVLGSDVSANIEGNIVDTAPRHKTVAAVLWQANAYWNINAQWINQGRYFLDPENQWQYPGHELLNLYVTWQLHRDWQWFGAITNVLDKRYADRADVSFGEPRYFPGAGMGVNLGLRYMPAR